MKTRTRSFEGAREPFVRLICLPRVTLLAAICGVLAVSLDLAARDQPGKHSAGNGEQNGVGAYFNAEASAKDVGLPIYPGARPHKDKDDDKPSAKFGLWGNAFAFKLAVLKLESNDSPEKVAAFYKKALGKYGTVLDCANPSSPASEKQKSASSKQLDYESDKPDPGNLEFKAGTKEKQHVVGIRPNGQGSIIDLVYIESPDSDKQK
jgi:hypothetical protein